MLPKRNVSAASLDGLHRVFGLRRQGRPLAAALLPGVAREFLQTSDKFLKDALPEGPNYLDKGRIAVSNIENGGGGWSPASV